MNCIRRFALLTAIALAAGALACTDSSGPTKPPVVVPPSALTIVTLPAISAPPLCQDSVGFWARTDQDREVTISFNDGSCAPGEKFMKFEVKKGSLSQRPDGSAFAAVDSIFIWIKPAPDSVLFDFQPSGLRFKGSRPARLELEYEEAEITDSTIENQINLWVQEQPGDSLLQVGSVKSEEFNEVQADILGFSRYALAY
jgi:hypothetical protein